MRLGWILNSGGNWAVSEQLSASFKEEMWLAGDAPTLLDWQRHVREFSGTYSALTASGALASPQRG